MDTRLYDSNDMVKIGCNDCMGCHDCCQGMGESIVLDPYDIWQLETHLHLALPELIQDKIELHVTDGLILPHMKMQGNLERCVFLNEKGRCNIHPFRPGLCRLFPLGRNYEEGRLSYFLLEDACPNGNMKVKVKKWLDIPNNKSYEKFLVAWHELRKELLKQITDRLTDVSGTDLHADERMKQMNMRFLHIFFEETYTEGDFYPQFENRYRQMRKEMDSWINL